ncbi:MAG: hypothetical protein J6M12_01840 [Clostridia bacterium]|nr:hypothetical protein [Clostridia bacterium]
MGKKTTKITREKRREQEQLRKSASRKSFIKVLLSTLCILAALALLITGGVLSGQALYNSYLDSGKSYRSIVSYKTEHFQIDNAMLSYYFYDYLYDGLLERLGMEHPDDLKEKDLSYTDEESGKKESVSYFRYYNEVAAMNFQSDLLYAEAAVCSGITLSDKDLTFISNHLSSLENSASDLGMSVNDYLSVTYGRGVKLSDVEKTLKITALAEKLYARCYAGQQITEQEVQKYLSEHDMNFTKVDYYLHILMIPDGATDAEKEAIRKKADKLMSCESEEDFLTELRAQLNDTYGDDESFDVEEEIQNTILSETVGTVTEETSELDRFLYDPENKVGDSYLSVGKRSYGVVRIAKEHYSTDLPLDTLRIIRLDYENFPSKADALSAINALKKALTGKSEEEFIKSVQNESQDEVTILQKGYYILDDAQGIVEQLAASKLTDAQKGDLIQFSNNQSIWLAYYCGKGKTASEAYAEEILRTQKFSEQANDLADTYPMEYSTSKITKIAPLLSAEDVG